MGKSRGRNPTLAQKKMMAAAGLIVKNWLVIKDTDDELRLVSKGSGRSRRIKKEVRL